MGCLPSLVHIHCILSCITLSVLSGEDKRNEVQESNSSVPLWMKSSYVLLSCDREYAYICCTFTGTVCTTC